MIPSQQPMMIDTALAFEQAIKNPKGKPEGKYKQDGGVEVGRAHCDMYSFALTSDVILTVCSTGWCAICG